MGDYKVYLGNIPDDTRDRDVEKLFKSYGRIRNVVIKVMFRKVKNQFTKQFPSPAQ